MNDINDYSISNEDDNTVNKRYTEEEKTTTEEGNNGMKHNLSIKKDYMVKLWEQCK